MNLKKILSLPVVSTDLPGNSKDEILENLIDILAAAGKIEDPKAALQCVLEREEKMSTGIQEGVAIPHGKTDTLDELVACVALKKEGVDFKALDGKPSRIFILTLSPLNRTGPHVQFLAEISRLLNDRTKRERLLQAETKEEMLDLLTSR